MLKSVSFQDFKGIAHLATSQLFATHDGRFAFASDRPTVIVGPNGAGKSALMQTLATRFLAWFTCESALDKQYVMERDSETLWAERGWRYRHEYDYMPGMTCETDNAPALFYRPGHVPGNETSITHAMMTGYYDEARAHAQLVDKKSSGQQGQALLARIEAVLEGEPGPSKYLFKNWHFGTEPRDLSNRGWTGDWEYKAEELKKLFGGVESGTPLILMDEPEQSLDARAEMCLWNKIAAVDCTRVQVIVATHSLYPLLHQDRFHLIEAVPGYADEVLAELRRGGLSSALEPQVAA